MLQLWVLSPAVPLDGPVIAPLAPWDDYTHSSFLLSVKGAPEVLMPRCSHVLDLSGGPPIATASILEFWNSWNSCPILLYSLDFRP